MCKEKSVIKLDVTKTYEDGEKHTETGRFTSTTWSEKAWMKKLTKINKRGISRAKSLLKQGRRFLVIILAPKDGVEGTQVTLSSVVLDLDGRLAHRQEICDVAVDLLTKLNQINELDHLFPVLLSDAIEGSGTYKGSFGEFFELYGEFAGNENQGETRGRMFDLIGNQPGCTKVYIERGNERDEPLPLAVRNTIAHPTQDNKLDPRREDLKKSIELLKTWLGKSD